MFKGFGFHSLATLDLGCLWQEVGWRPQGTAKIYSFSLNSSRSMTCVCFLWEEKTLKQIYSKAPWKESYFKPRQRIKKQRHHFAVKGVCSHSYSFSSTRYRCESWTTKKAEHRRTDAFNLWCWGRLLRVPGTARWSKQSVLKEVNPG